MKKLPPHILVKNRILELFYSVKAQYRNSRIPEWFSTYVGVPKYLYRLPGKLLSVKQVAVSTITRLYYMYRFVLQKGRANTNLVIQMGKYDGLHHILNGIYSCRRWYVGLSIVLRRLKVLLCPFMGLL